MRNTFINRVSEIAREDSRVILMTGDLGFGVVNQFAQELPNQFINFGINEQAMMSAAAGLAKVGFKPIVYSIANFPTFRCMEQIRNDVCYMNLDVTIVAVGAGFSYGTAGYSHHLVEDISALSSLPNMQIFSPADSTETERVATSFLDRSGPKYIRLGKGGESPLTVEFDQTQPGFSQLEGSKDFAIISTGNILEEAVKVRNSLPGIKPTLISLFSFEKLKECLLTGQYSKIVTLEEHILRGGFGSFIRENASQPGVEIQNFGIKNIHTKANGDQTYLREFYGISALRITKSLLRS